MAAGRWKGEGQSSDGGGSREERGGGVESGVTRKEAREQKTSPQETGETQELGWDAVSTWALLGGASSRLVYATGFIIFMLSSYPRNTAPCSGNALTTAAEIPLQNTDTPSVFSEILAQSMMPL